MGQTLFLMHSPCVFDDCLDWTNQYSVAAWQVCPWHCYLVHWMHRMFLYHESCAAEKGTLPIQKKRFGWYGLIVCDILFLPLSLPSLSPLPPSLSLTWRSLRPERSASPVKLTRRSRFSLRISSSMTCSMLRRHGSPSQVLYILYGYKAETVPYKCTSMVMAFVSYWVVHQPPWDKAPVHCNNHQLAASLRRWPCREAREDPTFHEPCMARLGW